ncbi:hypothetical protein FKR81_25245 [Lentzea tibetensis]|uniref:HTH luxR-type domain-containing protein n=1 Tax=Lentzea tibetensis TaxID=2591470 RepID=A0A563ENV5_9PSEU|nr:LuxR family transcriptional regulator [Lentzea tibetensis]TWP48990.1 hypothetical protein FKR81_25245 [Lentzea tibetensis]
MLLTARTMPWDDRVLERAELGNLTREATGELVRAALGDVDSTRLWQRSEGNPLYLNELIKAGEAEVSPQLAEVVWANLGRLDAPQRHALELLAYGEPLDVGVFATLTGSEMVDGLEERGLVTVRATRAQLGHPLYGELLRRTCPTLRSRQHRRQLAGAVSDDPLRVAIWRLESDSEISARELVSAAELALAARDVDLTERLCRAAAARGGAVAAAAVLGQALNYSRRPDEAEALLSETMAIADDPVDVARLGLARANCLFYGFGREREARELIDAVDRPELPADLRWYLRLARIGWSSQSSPVQVIRREIEELRSHPALPGWVRSSAVISGALCELRAGRHRSTLALLAERPAAGGPANPWQEDSQARMRCISLLSSGGLDEAESLATRLRAEVVDDPRGVFTTVSIACVLSRCAQLRGHAGRALRHATTATSFPRTRLMSSDVAAMSELVRAAALHGRVREARTALEQAEEAWRPAWRITGFMIDAARTWLLAAEGSFADAAASALTTAGRTRADGLHGLEAEAWHDAARFGADTSDRLVELASQLGDPMTVACAVHALGRARGDAATLDDAAARFSSLGATLFAAEALAERVRLHGGGVARHRLATLADGLEGVALDTVRVPRDGRLTPRQLEVARHAIAGLTSQQIAGLLHTSKRTVDNHLHAVYTTLGVAGRAELKGALEP